MLKVGKIYSLDLVWHDRDLRGETRTACSLAHRRSSKILDEEVNNLPIQEVLIDVD